MSKQRVATPEAEQAAIAAAGLTAEIDRYEQLAADRRRERARLWSVAQDGGMSYVRLGEISQIHSSKVHEAVTEHRAVNTSKPKRNKRR